MLAFLVVHATAFNVRGAHTLRQKASMHVSELYPFYHTTDAIHAEAERLAQSCEGFHLDTVTETAGGSSVSIDIASMKKPGSNPKNKMYILFGEHARELISPESGLHFLKTLCGETDTSDYVKSALEDTEFRVVLNGNPHSRQQVEAGEYCLRVNENGVDLNRNWDEKWEPDPPLAPQDTSPGPKPFSEPETQIFRNDVTDQRPDSFLTVHSGTLGMYMPWAFDLEHLAQRNGAKMREILRDVDQSFCQCPYGAAGKEVGYECPGTCLDYVYDKLNTSYAFAFEIYIDPDQRDDLHDRWEEKMKTDTALVAEGVPHLAHADYSDMFSQAPSDFVQLKKAVRREMDCFTQFNPTTEADFMSTLDTWSRAYSDVARKVAANL